MNRRCIVTPVIALLIILTLALPPGMVWAQGAWPPIEVQSSTEVVGNLIRDDITINNVSKTDLADVMVSIELPAGVTFNRFESISYASTKFDGKDVYFTIIKVPALKSVGPLSYYIEAKGTAPETIKAKIYVRWRGANPGDLTLPEVVLGTRAAAAQIQAATVVPTAAAPTAATPAPAPASPSTFQLWDTLAKLKTYKWVDLTNSFAPGIPRWPGFPDAQFKTIYDYDKDGFYAQEFVHVGQYGTHMDPPAHFIKGLRTIDEIDLKEMMAPLVVINVADKVAANPDYELTVDDVKAWEAKYGPVPEGAFVAMRSDWSKRWPDQAAYENKDAKGQAHYPGWSLDALKYLYETRKIGASGHEPADTDAAVAQNKTGFAAETYVLNTNHYQIELMTNLDQVPEAGAIVFAVVPKPKDGSGFPARVFAIVP